jgi:hypothetical protein
MQREQVTTIAKSFDESSILQLLERTAYRIGM